MSRTITLPSLLVLLALACYLTGTGTPAPASTQTTSTEPPAPLRIVYPDNVNGIRGSNLWIIEGSAAPRQLTSGGQDASPQLSDDGRLVAFRRIVDPHLGLEELWAIDSDGGNERLLVSQGWLSNVKPGENTSVFLSEWAPGAHRLAFNTRAVFEDAGFAFHDNLYLVNADDGSTSTLLPPGSNAGWFDFSPDGAQIALSSQTTISLIDADGGGRRDPISYQAPARGEGIYLARADWSSDGMYLRAAIPSNDPAAPEATLWQIPADGTPAYQLGTLSGDFAFFSPQIPLYAPDLGHIAFARQTGDPSTKTTELHIAGGDGSDERMYDSGQSLQWLGWAPDGRRFIYQKGGLAFLGEIGAAPRPLFTDSSTVFSPRWAGDDQVIFFTGERGNWQLRLGTPGGASVLLAAPSGDMAQFDFCR